MASAETSNRETQRWASVYLVFVIIGSASMLPQTLKSALKRELDLQPHNEPLIRLVQDLCDPFSAFRESMEALSGRNLNTGRICACSLIIITF